MKKEVKKRLKKNYKLLIGIVIGGIISGVGVYASATLSSSDITYDNSKSGLTSTNLNGAIDELNKRANTLSSSKPCRVIHGVGTETSDEIKCGTEEFYVLYPSGDSITVLTKYPIEGGVATLGEAIGCGGPGLGSYIENPSYAQNKNCGSSSLQCGDAGNNFSSQYKKVLNKIGLSDSIEVTMPSISELNKAGCDFSLTPVVDQDNGSCNSLPWLQNVVVTDIMGGVSWTTRVIVQSAGFLGFTSALCNGNYMEAEKLVVKIPTKDILIQ